MQKSPSQSSEKNPLIHLVMDGSSFWTDRKKLTGIERYVRALIPRFLDNKIHIHLFLPIRKQPLPPHFPADTSTLHVHFSALPFPGASGRVLWFLLWLPFRLRWHFSATIKKEILSEKLIQQVRKIVPFFTKKRNYPRSSTAPKKTDTVIFWGACNRLPFSCLKRIKSVLTLHDLVAIKCPKTMRFAARIAAKITLRPSLKKACHIVAISRSVQEDLSNFMPTLKSPHRLSSMDLTR